MKAVSPAHRTNNLPTPPLREYYSRILAYIAVAASVAAGNYAHYFGNELLWLVPYTLLLYPHLAHHVSARFKYDHPQQTYLVLLFLDALHAGAAIAPTGVIGSALPDADTDPGIQRPDHRRPAATRPGFIGGRQRRDLHRRVDQPATQS